MVFSAVTSSTSDVSRELAMRESHNDDVREDTITAGECRSFEEENTDYIYIVPGKRVGHYFVRARPFTVCQF